MNEFLHKARTVEVPRRAPPPRLDIIEPKQIAEVARCADDLNASVMIYLGETDTLQKALIIGDEWLQPQQKGRISWINHPLGALLAARGHFYVPKIIPVIAEQAISGLSSPQVCELGALAGFSTHNSWNNLRIIPQGSLGEDPLPSEGQALLRGIAHLLYGGVAFYFDHRNRANSFIYSGATSQDGQPEGLVKSTVRAAALTVEFGKLLEESVSPKTSIEILGRIATEKIKQELHVERPITAL